MKFSQIPANEPVLIGNAVTAVLTATAAFGFHWNTETIATVATISQLTASLLIRANVTPDAKPPTQAAINKP